MSDQLIDRLVHRWLDRPARRVPRSCGKWLLVLLAFSVTGCGEPGPSTPPTSSATAVGSSAMPSLEWEEDDDGVAEVRIDEAAMRAFCAEHGLPALPALNAVDAYAYRRLHEHVQRAVADPGPEGVARLGLVFDGNEFKSEAAACYEVAVARGTHAPVVWHMLGCAAAKLGDHERAVEAFTKTLELVPDSSPTLARLAEALIDLGRIDDAVPYAERYAEARPNDPVGAFLRGRIATERGAWREAYTALRTCVEGNPQHGRALFLLARVARQLGDDAAATRYGERAGALPRGGSVGLADAFESETYRLSDSSAYHQALMNTAWRAQQYARAYDSARELARRHPKDVLAHRNLASLSKLTGRMDEAVGHAEDAVALNPRYVKGLITLAELYRDVGRHDEAIETVDRALEIDPEYWSGYLSRGAILLGAGRSAEALASTRIGVERLPDLAVGHEVLAQCHLALGDTDAAQDAARRVLELEPRNRWARSVLE